MKIWSTEYRSTASRNPCTWVTEFSASFGVIYPLPNSNIVTFWVLERCPTKEKKIYIERHTNHKP